MAGGSVTIRKDVSGTLVVDITSAAGGTPTFYSDAALTASVSFPDSITTSKTYYIGVNDQYVLSVKRNGLEIANSPDGTRSFRLEDTHLSVSPGPDASNTEAASEGASLTASNAFTGNNTFTVASGVPVTITNTGSGNSLLVEDSASTDSTPFVVTAAGDVGIGTASPAVKLDVVGVVAVPLGSAALPSITPTGDPNTGIWSPAADTLAVSTGGTERLRVTSGGSLGVGVTPAVNLHVGSDTSAQARVQRNTTDASGPIFAMVKQRGTSASPTIVASGDEVGRVSWFAYDGASRIETSRIQSSVDGTPGTNDMPSRLEFLTTADGTAAPTERMRIDSSGNVGIGVTAPAGNLNISSDTAMVQRNEQNSTDAVGGLLQFFKRRGTKASPTIVASGDAVGSLDFRAYDGASAQQMALIAANVDGTPGSGDMPGRLSFWTTPDGSTTLTERMRIDNAGLITGSGTSLGAWTAYTPTLGGTGWAIGDGTRSGAYCQIGKMVFFRTRITFGASSTYGASAALTMTLPVTASATIANNAPAMNTRYIDSSAGAYYHGNVIPASTTVIGLYVPGTAGLLAALTATAPFTFESTDVVYVSGTYEAA